LFSWRFLLGVASLVGLLLGIGTVIWLLERRRNPHHFRPKPLPGITDGIWWSAVTMATVGYGDKTPMTWAGRLVSLVWMFGSIFFEESRTGPARFGRLADGFLCSPSIG
jgi:polar amino acid transport system substrate-binding protein